jgi:hypothetical protein
MSSLRILQLAAITLAGLVVSAPVARGDEIPAVVGKLKKLVDEPLKPAPGDDEIQKLMKERYNAAVMVVQSRLQEYMAGRGTLQNFEDAIRKVRDARLELTDKPAEQLPILELCLGLAREVEGITDARFQAGQIGAAERDEARRARIDAEIHLLRVKKKIAADKRP